MSGGFQSEHGGLPAWARDDRRAKKLSSYCKYSAICQYRAPHSSVATASSATHPKAPTTPNRCNNSRYQVTSDRPNFLAPDHRK